CLVSALIERSCNRKYETTRSLRFRSGTNNQRPPPDDLVTNRITNKGFQPKGCSQIECKNHLMPEPPSHFSSRLLPLSFFVFSPVRRRCSPLITASERLYPHLPMETTAWPKGTESVRSSTGSTRNSTAAYRSVRSSSSPVNRGR